MPRSFAELAKHPFSKIGSSYVESAGDGSAYFLKHIDDKGDHILVDEDLNIPGIIDWEMALLVHYREAFSLSFVSGDMRALCSGNASRGYEGEARLHMKTSCGAAEVTSLHSPVLMY